LEVLHVGDLAQRLFHDETKSEGHVWAGIVTPFASLGSVRQQDDRPRLRHDRYSTRCRVHVASRPGTLLSIRCLDSLNSTCILVSPVAPHAMIRAERTASRRSKTLMGLLFTMPVRALLVAFGVDILVAGVQQARG
jgi:hypothetical protein